MNAYDDCPLCGSQKDTRAGKCKGCHLSATATDEQKRWLADNINALTWGALARGIGKGVSATRHIAASIGLSKSKESALRHMKVSRWGTMSALERYNTHVIKRGGCWGWAGPKVQGYGIFQSGNITHRAHRFAYEMFSGQSAEGLHVCHKCDNPECSNPDHLFAGTQADNMGDAASKGRVKRGSRHHASVLTEGDVLEIREMGRGGIRQKDIARVFGTSRPNISVILSKKAWRHVP